MADYSALWGPLGTIVVLVLGWLLQQWTKRVEKKDAERKETARKEQLKREEEDRRDAARTDIADKVSEVWERTSGRLDIEIASLKEKCNRCDANLDLVRRDFGAFIDSMEAWTDELAQQVSVPAESQRRARVMFTAARQSHLSHNRGQ